MARRVVTDGTLATAGISEICIALSVLYKSTVFASQDKDYLVPVLYVAYPAGVATLVIGISNVRKSFGKKEPHPSVSEFNSLSNYNPFADIDNLGDRNPYRLVG